MFEGVPSYPDFGRFWEIVEKHKVNQFYTAPTAIRALAKHSVSLVESNDLSSLRVLGTVGEPINEEAWNWYDKNIELLNEFRLHNHHIPKKSSYVPRDKRYNGLVTMDRTARLYQKLQKKKT
mgnify:CR=1 FL=1